MDYERCTTYKYCFSFIKVQRGYDKKTPLGGVAKGAFSEEEADKRFEAWLAEKEDKISAKKDNLSKAEAEAKKARIAVEKEISDTRAQELANAKAAFSC